MIEIYIDGRSLGVKGAGFTVFMKHQRRSLRRSIKCGKLTSNITEIKALEYALKSIKPEFNNEGIEVKTSGRFANLMLERHDGIWTRDAKANHSLINEIRKEWTRFSNATINTDIDSSIMSGLKEMTNRVIKTGIEEFDKS